MDNKTASPSDEEFLKMYQIQLDSYALLLQKHGYRITNYGYLVYYIPEKGTPDKGIIFRAEIRKLKIHPQRALKVFKAAVKLLKRPRPLKSHKDCEMCAWLKSIEGM
jgi:hypothetical protein